MWLQFRLNVQNRRHKIHSLKKEDDEKSQLKALKLDSRNLEPDADSVEEFNRFRLQIEELQHQLRVYNGEAIRECNVALKNQVRITIAETNSLVTHIFS